MLVRWVHLGILAFAGSVLAIGQQTCASFKSGTNTFSVVSGGTAAPIFTSFDDWGGVHRVVADFASDIDAITGKKPSITNATSTVKASSPPILIGTLGNSSLINAIVNHTNMDVSSIQGKWESFIAKEVQNPLPGLNSAFVIMGSDKRGTIFGVYDLSEQFGQSPWYWWADVLTTTHSELHLSSAGCSHGEPTVKYRGIFLNDEQPALQNWAMEKFTNGIGAALTNSPFNSHFYTKLFELLLRIKANIMWPAQWSSAFAVDDPLNQAMANYYGIVMGTSHEEPMMRSIPVEWGLFGSGPWDFYVNSANITEFWKESTIRARPFESMYSIGMRGDGDEPVSSDTSITTLEEIVSVERGLIQSVYNISDASEIPQMWCLYEEVEGYYDEGMRVPDDVILLWTDDDYGNIRRYPVADERNRSGGAGVYYHYDMVASPRDYKWITSTQISKVWEQMSLAVERDAVAFWMINVGDLKPYEMSTEFVISYGWNASVWNADNVDSFITSWGQREWGLSASQAATVTDIVANLTTFNARRKPELLNSTTFSLVNYREAENVVAAWQQLNTTSSAIYNSLSAEAKPSFFQLVQHPVEASSTLGLMQIYAGMNNLRASQARLSANELAEQVMDLFVQDYDIEEMYHTILDGKWDHMMDQTHVGYVYWQQPMQNTMPPITMVPPKKQALPGIMRIVPEGSMGAWPGDDMFDCGAGYNCPAPTLTLDSYVPFGNRFVDVGAAGPNPFTFTVSSNASWVKLSPTKGSISSSNTEQRVFISVTDWSAVGAGAIATVTFNATATGNQKALTAVAQDTLSVPVSLVANRTQAPSGFSGHVEGDGVVSIEAGHASRNTSVDGIAWTNIPHYGRTISGVSPFPRMGNNGTNYTAGTGPSIEYDFHTFNSIGGNGTVNVTTYVSPSLNANGADRPIGFAVQIDSDSPQTSYYMPPAAPGQQPAAWGGNDGFAANVIVPVMQSFNATPGSHTLKIWMVEPAVVVQKIVINTGGQQSSYLGPPESVMV